jgi:hypothetical protein
MSAIHEIEIPADLRDRLKQAGIAKNKKLRRLFSKRLMERLDEVGHAAMSGSLLAESDARVISAMEFVLDEIKRTL